MVQRLAPVHRLGGDQHAQVAEDVLVHRPEDRGGVDVAADEVLQFRQGAARLVGDIKQKQTGSIMTIIITQ